MVTHRAAKNRSQGRDGWCALFRHPLRRDKDGKAQRVRKGLGTKDDNEADRLVAQLNCLLEDESYWTLTEKERATREFDPRVISIFYDDIEARVEDPWVVRDSVIHLYGPEDGYTRVMFVGTTGAGKTTLLRQLIGTDPQKERFPSTSTAKTTVFDTEIICADGPYRAVVSFLSRERVRFYIEECVAAAVAAAAENEDEKQVLRRLLEHSDQRFRLSYLLGTLRKVQQEESELTDEEDDNDEGEEESEVVELADEERRELDAHLREFIHRVIELGHTLAEETAQKLGVNVQELNTEERDVFLELIEDELRDNETAQAVVDDIVDEVETKFSLLENGSIIQTGVWPKVWTFETEDRSEFIRTINRFSSNYAPNFGRLLTPVVQGLRVSGPFRPMWDSEGDLQRLVLIDGEGLGHTPESASSLPTSVTKRYERVDTILLVDNAAQPMQAGAQAVLRSVAVSGHDSKLRIVFTHFDQVKGDNLPNQAAKRNHVTASLDNTINGLESVLGSGAVRGLRRYLTDNIFFVSNIQEELSPRARFTRNELTKLLLALQPVELISGEAVPTYDMGNLVLGVRSATEQFNDHWRARLNLGFKSGVDPEHWTRVKALSRRFALQWEDQYDNLRPVADLIRMLSEHINGFITKPRKWEPSDPLEEEKQIVIDKVAQEFFSRLHDLANKRLFMEHVAKWGEAFSRSGTGSTRVRARDIRDIYEEAAPVPGETPAPESVELLDTIRSMFKDAAEAAGAEVI